MPAFLRHQQAERGKFGARPVAKTFLLRPGPIVAPGRARPSGVDGFEDKVPIRAKQLDALIREAILAAWRARMTSKSEPRPKPWPLTLRTVRKHARCWRAWIPYVRGEV